MIRNAENRGFSAANNQGLRAARGEFLCLLNNDTVVTRGWLSTMIEHLRKTPRAGMIGPVSNMVGNEAKIPVGYTAIADMPRWAADYCRRHDGETTAMKMLGFFCVLLRREVYEKVGEMDEQFGVGYFEDTDYCYRVARAGYQLRCARDAFVHHWQGASFRLLGARRPRQNLQAKPTPVRIEMGRRQHGGGILHETCIPARSAADLRDAPAEAERLPANMERKPHAEREEYMVMNSYDAIAANPAKRIGLGRLALALAAAWFCVHAAVYAVGMCRLDSVLYKHLEHVLKGFFGWQALGFLVTAIVVSRRRPAAAGRVLGGYLALSTAALLAFSAGRRDVRHAGCVALVDRLRGAGNAAGDRPGGRAAIRDLGRRRGRRLRGAGAALLLAGHSARDHSADRGRWWPIARAARGRRMAAAAGTDA